MGYPQHHVTRGGIGKPRDNRDAHSASYLPHGENPSSPLPGGNGAGEAANLSPGAGTQPAPV